MPNIHEYVLFDRTVLDPALAMRWPVFEEAYPGWQQWKSTKDFLVEWALDESRHRAVDTILATKTVRATMALSDDPFGFFYGLLDEKGLTTCSVKIDKGDYDYDYDGDIVSCAGAAFSRGELSPASLAVVCDLHASRVDPAAVLSPAGAAAVQAQTGSLAMHPGWPRLLPEGADGIGIAQTRKLIEFLLRAWQERWPLHGEDQKPRQGESIRSCVVARRLADAFGRHRLSKPCMFRWFEG